MQFKNTCRGLFFTSHLFHIVDPLVLHGLKVLAGGVVSWVLQQDSSS